jgi:ATP phosphoribosyltransferase regulatory subunit HisZ
VSLYGDVKVLDEARRVLPPLPGLREALDQLQWLGGQLGGATVSYDLGDLRGYAYYSGMRFGIYTPGASDALVRGGRYDEVGAVFGRNRPAVGFSLDVKELVGVVPKRPLKAAIRAPWGEQEPLRAETARLRASGETVVCVLPGPRPRSGRVPLRPRAGRRARPLGSCDPLISLPFSGAFVMNKTRVATWSWSAPSGATRARASWSTG